MLRGGARSAFNSPSARPNSRSPVESLAESLLLAGLGGIVGLGVAAAALRVLGAYQLPGGIDIRGLDLALDGVVYCARRRLAILTGLLPSASARRGGPQTLTFCRRCSAPAHDTPAESGYGRSLLRRRSRSALMLLAGSGLFLKSLSGR